MQDINKISKEVVNVCNTLKSSIEKLESKIVMPNYKSLSKEQKEKIDSEMEKFIDKLEMPDLKGDLAKFMQKNK